MRTIGRTKESETLRRIKAIFNECWINYPQFTSEQQNEMITKFTVSVNIYHVIGAQSEKSKKKHLLLRNPHNH